MGTHDAIKTTSRPVDVRKDMDTLPVVTGNTLVEQATHRTDMTLTVRARLHRLAELLVGFNGGPLDPSAPAPAAFNARLAHEFGVQFDALNETTDILNWLIGVYDQPVEARNASPTVAGNPAGKGY